MARAGERGLGRETGLRSDPEPQVGRGGEAAVKTWAFSPGPSWPEQLCTLGVGCTGARGLGWRCELGERSASSPCRQSGPGTGLRMGDSGPETHSGKHMESHGLTSMCRGDSTGGCVNAESPRGPCYF